jgi:serine protease DegS
MPNSSLRRHTFFLAGSVLAGLGMALVAVWLWPQLVRRAPPPEAVFPTANFPPVAVQEGAAGSSRRASQDLPATGSTAATDSLAQTAGGSFASAVQASAPAVVSIYTSHVERVPGTPLEQMLGSPWRQLVQQKLGSGVIVDNDGHIVTNFHVVSRSEEIAVQLADGRESPAKLVGSDPDTDLAVLKIDLQQLPVMKLGRSDRVAVGDVVLAIGNPFGLLAQTVTHGIVSATGRAGLDVATFEDFIQTDAAINEGNSGGALVNTRGQLIGINTAVLGKEQGAEGLGIAIPVDLVRGVMSEILQHGRVIRGWIGIQARDVDEQTARQYNLPHAGVVINPDRNSPAAKAGLKIGDVITGIDGQQVKSAQDLRARIASRKPGGQVRIELEREDRGVRTLDLEVEVVEAPQGQQ